MRTVKLNDGGEMPALGLGTWDLVGEDATEMVAKALRMGYRLIDTATMYGNEREVGSGLAASGVERKEVFLVTKVWRSSLYPEDLRASVETSLKRLQVSYVDGLLIHWPNREIPLTETLTAMAKLKEEGLVKYMGVANFNQEWLSQTQVNGIGVSVNQVEFHPSMNQPALLRYCQERGIRLMAHTPLGQGRDLKEEAVQQIAHYRKKSPAQVILDWLWQKGVVAIPKAANDLHLTDNWESQTWVLTEDEMEMMEGVQQRPRLVDPGWVNFDE